MASTDGAKPDQMAALYRGGPEARHDDDYVECCTECHQGGRSMNRMMFRNFGGLALITLLVSCAATQAGPAGSPAVLPPANVAPDDTRQLAEDAASERARRLLADHGISVDEYRLVFRETTQWSDSSLGCRKPGEMYTQALASGQTLRFSDSIRTYEVHVAGDNVVLCPMIAAGDPKEPRRSTSARNLDLMVEQARSDLAQQLDVTPADVELRDMAAAAWADSELGCADGSTVAAGPVHGYRLYLAVRGALYTYHTDLARVLACPPIEKR